MGDVAGPCPEAVSEFACVLNNAGGRPLAVEVVRTSFDCYCCSRSVATFEMSLRMLHGHGYLRCWTLTVTWGLGLRWALR